MTVVKELAAHATLVSLASLAGGKSKRFLLNDDVEVDSLADLVPHIVNLADSADCIECRAKSSRGLLRIQATPLREANIWHHRLNIDLLEGNREGVIPRSLIMQDDADKSVLIHANPYSVRLSIAAVRAWFRSYLIHGLGLQGNAADGKETANGVVWVLTVKGKGIGIEIRADR